MTAMATPEADREIEKQQEQKKATDVQQTNKALQKAALNAQNKAEKDCEKKQKQATKEAKAAAKTAKKAAQNATKADRCQADNPMTEDPVTEDPVIEDPVAEEQAVPVPAKPKKAKRSGCCGSRPAKEAPQMPSFALDDSQPVNMSGLFFQLSRIERIPGCE